MDSPRRETQRDSRLSELPAEILLRIISHLDFKALSALAVLDPSIKETCDESSSTWIPVLLSRQGHDDDYYTFNTMVAALQYHSQKPPKSKPLQLRRDTRWLYTGKMSWTFHEVIRSFGRVDAICRWCVGVAMERLQRFNQLLETESVTLRTAEVLRFRRAAAHFVLLCEAFVASEDLETKKKTNLKAISHDDHGAKEYLDHLEDWEYLELMSLASLLDGRLDESAQGSYQTTLPLRASLPHSIQSCLAWLQTTRWNLETGNAYGPHNDLLNVESDPRIAQPNYGTALFAAYSKYLPGFRGHETMYWSNADRSVRIYDEYDRNGNEEKVWHMMFSMGVAFWDMEHLEEWHITELAGPVERWEHGEGESAGRRWKVKKVPGFMISWEQRLREMTGLIRRGWRYRFNPDGMQIPEVGNIEERLRGSSERARD